jgi:hypothetical protein
MSCAWTLLSVMLCFIVSVWISNCFSYPKSRGLKYLWHMAGRSIKIRSLPTPYIISSVYDFPVVSPGKVTFRRTMLLLCMGLGLVATNTLSEALTFIPQSVLRYAIDNNLLDTHGWSRVRILAQKTSDIKMLDKIRRRGGQIKKAHKLRMKPKSQAGTEGVVPVNPNGGKRS